MLDLSCRMGADGAYYIVTDRWQKFTSEKISLELLERLSAYADEFLIHAVDVEGRARFRLYGFWEAGAKFRLPMPGESEALRI